MAPFLFPWELIMSRLKVVHLTTVPPVATDPDTGKIRLVIDGEKCQPIQRTSTGTQVLVRLVHDGYMAELLPSEVR
jgi:hypothetical protein